MIAASNDHHGIDRRTYVATHSKAGQLDVDKLAKVTDPYVAYSVRLQQALGLCVVADK